MEAHTIKGEFVKKYFGDEKARIINFPSTLRELVSLIEMGKLTIDDKDFPITEEKICSWAYRGFSLTHQSGGAETLSEEEKAARKAERSAKQARIKKLLLALDAKGKSLDDLLADLQE